MSQKLSQLRNSIDLLDKKLLVLLNERASIAEQVAHYKKNEAVEVYAPEREETVVKRIVGRNRGPLAKEDVASIFSEIISACRALQSRLKVVYLGPEGTFTHLAALKKFGTHVELTGKDNVGEIFRDVERGAADCGVVQGGACRHRRGSEKRSDRSGAEPPGVRPAS